MNYIWDLDGTLIDSYDGILKSIMDLLDYFNLKMKKDDVYKYIIKNSVHDFLINLSNDYFIDLLKIQNKYAEFRLETQNLVSLNSNAYEALKYLYDKGNNLFVFTHKGLSTYDILKRFNIDKFFKEIITSNNNFKRKPDPEAINYIINKYNLKKEDTFYIGDRPIDMLCAKNANIKGILLKNDLIDLEIDAYKKINNLIELKEE